MDNLIFYGICILAIAGIMLLLPSSPFSLGLEMPQQLRDVLGYINWVIPFKMISNTMIGWTGVIGGYYLLQITLRWVRAI